jgi:hypothetical protein
MTIMRNYAAPRGGNRRQEGLTAEYSEYAEEQPGGRLLPAYFASSFRSAMSIAATESKAHKLRSERHG